MFFVKKAAMRRCIKNSCAWLNTHQRVKEWMLFVLLWLGGVLIVLFATYLIKYLIKSLY